MSLEILESEKTFGVGVLVLMIIVYICMTIISHQEEELWEIGEPLFGVVQA